jgi:hypothetical protein
MSPDTPALRGLLGAIDHILTVPPAAHHADDDLELAELEARTKTVALAMRTLLDGPLDNCAIQAYARFLTGQDTPVHYQARVA